MASMATEDRSSGGTPTCQVGLIYTHQSLTATWRALARPRVIYATHEMCEISTAEAIGQKLGVAGSARPIREPCAFCFAWSDDLNLN